MPQKPLFGIEPHVRQWRRTWTPLTPRCTVVASLGPSLQIPRAGAPAVEAHARHHRLCSPPPSGACRSPAGLYPLS